MESMEVTPPREGNLLTTSPKEGSGRFIRTMLRPSLERTIRQLGRKVYSPTATDSTAASVKAVVLLAARPDGLVVLVSVPLVLVLRLVLPVVLKSQIRAVEKKSGMNQLSGLIPFAQTSPTLWTITMTRNIWKMVNPPT